MTTPLSPPLRTALATALLATLAPAALAQDYVATLSARGQLGRIFYQRADGREGAVGPQGSVGQDVLNLGAGDRVWIGGDARAEALVVYARDGERVTLGPGGRHRVRAAAAPTAGWVLGVLGEAARAVIALLRVRPEGKVAEGLAHGRARGPWAPALVLPARGRPGGGPWSVLPGGDPLAWEGVDAGRAGDSVRLWVDVSPGDCTGGTPVAALPRGPAGLGGGSRPVYPDRAALLPGVPYRIELVGAGGRPRASACFRFAPPAEAEAVRHAVRAVEREVDARLPGGSSGPLVAALLAGRGFVPDALLRLDRALADNSDDVGALRLQDAIRASLTVP